VVELLNNLKNALATQIGLIILFMLPPAAVIWAFYRRGKREKSEVEAPFNELRRRPAGESARLKIESLSEEIDPWLMTLIFAPVVFAIVLTLQRPGWVVGIFAFLVCAIFSALAERKLTPLVKQRAAYRLGFQGERFVAEELNQLMADGFRVFHDVPFAKYNIDHVLVGKTGVFAIETKTRRKRLAQGKQRYKVTFDGDKLQFATGWNDEWLNQARLNAKSLSQWLRSSAAETVAVKPILTIPGWLITRTGKSDVNVLNPKEILGFVLLPAPKPLDDGQIQRISHQLEEKCKLAVD
jgi:cbb3-type cytochrome oxidase subunit 3